MPKNGFKSITVKDFIYDRCKAYYEENRDAISYLGIFSFSGFMTWIYQMFMTDEYIQDRIKNKMKERLGTVTDLLA